MLLYLFLVAYNFFRIRLLCSERLLAEMAAVSCHNIRHLFFEPHFLYDFWCVQIAHTRMCSRIADNPNVLREQQPREVEDSCFTRSSQVTAGDLGTKQVKSLFLSIFLSSSVDFDRVVCHSLVERMIERRKCGWAKMSRCRRRPSWIFRQQNVIGKVSSPQRMSLFHEKRTVQPASVQLTLLGERQWGIATTLTAWTELPPRRKAIPFFLSGW